MRLALTMFMLSMNLTGPVMAGKVGFKEPIALEVPCMSTDFLFPDNLGVSFRDNLQILEIGCPNPGRVWNIYDCRTGKVAVAKLQGVAVEELAEMRKEFKQNTPDGKFGKLIKNAVAIGLEPVVRAELFEVASCNRWCKSSAQKGCSI